MISGVVNRDHNRSPLRLMLYPWYMLEDHLPGWWLLRAKQIVNVIPYWLFSWRKLIARACYTTVPTQAVQAHDDSTIGRCLRQALFLPPWWDVPDLFVGYHKTYFITWEAGCSRLSKVVTFTGIGTSVLQHLQDRCDRLICSVVCSYSYDIIVLYTHKIKTVIPPIKTTADVQQNWAL